MSKISCLFLIFLSFSILQSEIFFTEDFEYGVTYTDASVLANSKEISLWLNNALSDWSETGGVGVLESGNPNRRDCFTYKKREKNRLLGVKGVLYDHPEAVEVSTNGLKKWVASRELDKFQNDTSSKISGEFGFKYFKSDKNLTFIKRIVSFNDSLYIRFYFKIDKMATPRLIAKNVENLFTLNFLNKKQDEIKNIRAVLSKNSKYRLDLQIELDLSNATHEENSKNITIEMEKIYYLELLLFENKESSSWVASFWLNGFLIIDNSPFILFAEKGVCELLLFENHKSEDYFKDGNNDVEICIDDILIADKRAGPKSSSGGIKIIRLSKSVKDDLYKMNNYSYQISPLNEENLVGLEFQICKDFIWGKPLIARIDEPYFGKKIIKQQNFPSGQVVIRSRLKKKNFGWSNWSLPQYYYFNEDSLLDRPEVDSVIVKDFNGLVVDTIQAGLSYRLFLYAFDKVGFNNLYYNSIILCNADNLTADVFNKGGEFSPETNYYISLSNLEKLIFVKHKKGSDKTISIDKSYTSSYVDCSKECFKIENGYWQTNFKLNREALSGTWFIKTTFFNRQERPSVTNFKKIIVVASPIPFWEKYLFAIILIVLSIFLIILVVFAKNYLKSRNILKENIMEDSLEPNLKTGIELDFRVKLAKEFINENYSKSLSLAEVADVCSVHKSTLGVNFKKQLGKSVKEYLNMVRCQKATTLLNNPSLNISEISYRVGFDNPSYFIVVFKKNIGKTPTDFRNNP